MRMINMFLFEVFDNLPYIKLPHNVDKGIRAKSTPFSKSVIPNEEKYNAKKGENNASPKKLNI